MAAMAEVNSSHADGTLVDEGTTDLIRALIEELALRIRNDLP